MNIAGYPIAISGSSRHPGVGVVGQRLDLGQARIRLFKTVNGQRQFLADVPAPAEWPEETVYEQIVSFGRGVSKPVAARGATFSVDHLQFATPVPADAAEVYLRDGVGEPVQPYCADPSSCTSDQFNTPDPFMFYVSDRSAEELIARDVWADQELRTAGGIEDGADVGMMYLLKYTDPPGVDPFFWAAATNGIPDPNDLVLPVRNSYPTHYPSQFASDCTVFSCSHATANRSTTCGANYPCEQWMHIKAYDVIQWGAGNGGRDVHRLGTYADFDFGVEEWNYDEMGWGDGITAAYSHVRQHGARSYAKQVADDNGKCVPYSKLASYYSEPGNVELGLHGAWYMDGQLKQRDGTETPFCSRKMLGGVVVEHTVELFNQGVPDGMIIGSYGHVYKSWTFDWSCGGAVGLPASVQFGCDFNPSEKLEAWKRQDVGNLQF